MAIGVVRRAVLSAGCGLRSTQLRRDRFFRSTAFEHGGPTLILTLTKQPPTMAKRVGTTKRPPLPEWNPRGRGAEHGHIQHMDHRRDADDRDQQIQQRDIGGQRDHGALRQH